MLRHTIFCITQKSVCDIQFACALIVIRITDYSGDKNNNRTPTIAIMLYNSLKLLVFVYYTSLNYSGVATQVASGAYAPLSAKCIIFLVCDLSECMYLCMRIYA